ncbi:MAG: hypothetical protein HZA82_04745 [Thaumarchaeota archaeon]|nr:hypothetical protein [Nitrososphaerota archaeon]
MGDEKQEGQRSQSETKINYYIVVGIFVLLFFYQLGNYLEPQINTQLDFYELTFIMAYAAPGVLSLYIAKRYWGSEIFGRAYLALGAGYVCQAIGQTLFSIYQISYQVVNPYPYYPDIFFASFYFLAIYHLRTNSHYFKRKLSRGQKIVLIVIPAGAVAIYTIAMLAPFSVPGSVPDLLSQQITVGGTDFKGVPSTGVSSYQHIVAANTTYDLVPVDLSQGTIYPQIYDPKVQLNLIPIITHITVDQFQQHDQIFWRGFFMGFYYVAATSLIVAWSVVGFQIFRGTVLGAAWGILLVGLVLNSIGDITYVYSSIYYWDRGSISTTLWVGGGTLVTYALFKHRKAI